MREWAFWLSCAGILYTYAGYPALLWFWSRFTPRPVRKGPLQPHVSLVIAAHNEAAVIRRKLESCLAQDYPGDRLEILVGTDGCTDSTEKIVGEFASQPGSVSVSSSKSFIEDLDPRGSLPSRPIPDRVGDDIEGEDDVVK